MPAFTPPLNRIVRVCVTTVAVGRWFPQKAERLRKSLARFDPRIPFVPFVNHYPRGTPTTKETTYAFKPLAIRQRLSEGYDIVVWLDSAFVAQASITPFVAIARKTGHMVVRDDLNLRQYSADNQLTAFGISRPEAETLPIPLAGACAFEAHRGGPLLDAWVSTIPLFPGARSNATRQCSRDPKCLGSRHDQTLLGLLMHRMQTKYTTMRGLVSMSETPASHRGIVHHYPTL